MTEQDVFAWCRLTAADFSDKTLELRVEGDMPRVAAGRYAVIEAEKFRIVVMQAKLWREGQRAKA